MFLPTLVSSAESENELEVTTKYPEDLRQGLQGRVPAGGDPGTYRPWRSHKA